jgi:hypothetical protein
VVKALVLEGPAHDIMRGWRHFQIIIRLDGGERVTSCIGTDGSGPRFAEQLRGKFFAAGTWETIQRCKFCGFTTAECAACNVMEGRGCCAECVCEKRPAFPAPRPEILAELRGEHQTEFAA